MKCVQKRSVANVKELVMVRFSSNFIISLPCLNRPSIALNSFVSAPQVYVAMIRSLGMDVRIMYSLQPTTFKAADLVGPLAEFLLFSFCIPSLSFWDVCMELYCCIHLMVGSSLQKPKKGSNSKEKSPNSDKETNKSSKASKAESPKPDSSNKKAALEEESRYFIKDPRKDSALKKKSSKEVKGKTTAKNERKRKCASKVNYNEDESDSEARPKRKSKGPTKKEQRSASKVISNAKILFTLFNVFLQLRRGILLWGYWVPSALNKVIQIALCQEWGFWLVMLHFCGSL